MSGSIPDVTVGLRETNDDSLLGLKHVRTAGSAAPEEVNAFLDFLRQLLADPPSASFDSLRKVEEIPSLQESPVRWKRSFWTLYPLYIERLTVLGADEFGSWQGPVALRPERPGEWVLSDAVVRSESPFHWSRHRPAWAEWVAGAAGTGRVGTLSTSGGLACNVLEIPSEALRSGEIELRPAVLHALAPDGSACDRGDVAAQAALANAFWQTYWATGALRAERGTTFPVAFLPIDRSSDLEFSGPFAERYVSLRRRLFGRTAILAHALEALTRARALLFDCKRNTFCIASDYVPDPAGISASDLLLAVRELNRTGFVDAWTGSNRELFAGWQDAEERAGSGPPWAASGAHDAKIRSQATAEDYLLSVRPQAGSAAADLVRIHRVVPYAGCAFLRQVVHERERLEARGKLQGVDGDVLAATNSTFFLNFPEEYATLHSAMNDPVALLVEAGRTLQVKTLRRAAFVLAEDGRAVITTRAGNRLNAEALVFEGEGSSATFAENSDKSFRFNRFGPLFFGAVLVGDSIVETFEEIATEIPSNGWIVGDSEAFGGHIDPRRAAQVQLRLAGEGREVPVRHAFAVGPLLVEGGRPVPLGESREEFQPIVFKKAPSVESTRDLTRTELPGELLDCEKRGVPPTRFPYDWNQTRAPRTALGVRSDGTVVLVVVDGRADLPHSVGVTLAELAQVMINLGCEGAMNMDGGGSSVMFVTDGRARELKMRPELADGIVNLPSDLGGVERLLPVPLLVCRRKGS